MKAFIRFYNPTLLKYCKVLLHSAISIFTIALISSPATAQTIKWTGDGSSTLNALATSNFNTATNWDLGRVPSATDSVVIIVTKNKASFINLSANTTVKNLTFIVPNNNNNNLQVYLNAGAFTLTVNGKSTIDLQDDHPHNQIYIGVNDATSAGVIDFKGDVNFGLTNVRDAVYLIGNANSKIISRANFTMGVNSKVGTGSASSTPGTLLFDGTGTQNFIFNNTSNTSNFNNIVVGATNSPTVVVGGTNVPDNILGNITVANNATLDLNTVQLNRNTDGGSLYLQNRAVLRLAGLSSSAKNGSATLIPGSNFPSGFTNIVLDSTSTVEFYGTTQSIPGAAHNIKGYGNLTLNNSTKTLISSLATFRNLTIGANTTMALGNFNDTLKSNSVTTASVSAVPTTATISYSGSGAFVVERYLQAYKSWRLLATPIDIATSPTVSAAWRENNSTLTSTGYGTQITGPQGPGTASAAAVLDVYTQRGSLKSYDANSNNYVEVANANTTKVANTAGWYVFVRGDRGVGITGTTGATNLRIKGRIRTGDQTFTVPSNKFASVGNPFPSRIDFRTIYNSSISPSYYVWNPNPTGTFYNAGKYEVYVNYGDGNYRLGNSAGPIRNFIESGQAVFVQSITGGTFTIKESDKLGGSSIVSRSADNTGRQGVNNPTLEINLHTTDGNGQDVLADAAVLNFDAAFSNDLDNMDVRKIANTSDNLSIKKGTVNLVADRRAGLAATDTIFLTLSNTRVSNYHFNIDPSMLAYPSLQAVLVDKFLGTETVISLSDVTDYSFAITADAASRATDRFMITFKTVAPAVFTAIKAVRNDDNSVAVTWNMTNENNINNYSIERSIDGGTSYTAINSQMPTANNFGSPYYTFIDAAAPKEIVWYRIKANNISNGSFYSDKASAKAVEVNTKLGISIYPNQVVNGTVNLYFNNQAAGKYRVTIVNSAGEQLKQTDVSLNSNALAETININGAAAGMYQAIVNDANGKKVVIPFVKL